MNKKFYILWNPTSSLPPTVKFNDLPYAEQIAKEMAQRHGGKFYVMQAQGCAEVVEPVKLERY